MLPYDEPLQPHHQEQVDKLFKKHQHGYGRTANNLWHRQHSSKACQSASQSLLSRNESKRRERAEEEARKAILLAALEKREGWTEIQGELITVNGRAFVKSARAPSSTGALVKWFAKTHPDEVKRIEEEIVGKPDGSLDAA